MSLIDIVDEALKALNYEQTMSKILGGLFSDQKICKTCPHRYSREEPFSVISVDVKNHSNLVNFILLKISQICVSLGCNFSLLLILKFKPLAY
jgi:hypothetical protein